MPASKTVKKTLSAKALKKRNITLDMFPQRHIPAIFHEIFFEKNCGEIGMMLHTYFDSTGRPCAGRDAAGIK